MRQVCVLVWLQIFSLVHSTALYWNDAGPAPPQEPNNLLAVDSVAKDAVLNQLKRYLQPSSTIFRERLSAFENWLNLEDKQKIGDPAPVLMKRANNKDEINRFLTRLLRFTELDSYGGAGPNSNKKRSLYEIPIRDLPPAFVKAMEDGLQRPNNLEDDYENKGEGQLKTGKRSQGEDGSTRLTLEQLKDLIGKVKLDADPLKSMLEHVAMEMKEETGNRPMDDDVDYAEWFMEGQKPENGQIKKLDTSTRNGRYLRYGREEVRRGESLALASPESVDQEAMDVLNKRGYGDK